MTTDTKPKTKWTKLDAARFDPETAKLYAAFQTAQGAAKKAREAFEERLTKGITVPDGKKLALSFKFGLAVAMVDADDAKSPKGAVSLADYLKAQAA